ncbi:hypothetical protein QUF76_06350 [Desulfobacterales bacterium HSG16]|nr:hypothetical protein [Desulfobacterales bacterium HSG16]
MEEAKIKYMLTSCEHYEAAQIYSELAANKLAAIRGFKSSVVEHDGKFHVYLEAHEKDYETLEKFLGNIIVRLFFF